MKFLAVVAFTICVVSLPKYAISPLMWFAVGPFTMLTIAKIPLRFVLRQIIITSPFILTLAIVCVFFDKEIHHVTFGPWQWDIQGGILRCASIVGKFFVTMTALIALISATRFSDLLCGLERLGIPNLLVTQMGFLYRYIFLLIDKVGRYLRARSARHLKYLGIKKELSVGSAMIGSLLLTSLDMSTRVNLAMEARGFDGVVRTLSRTEIKLSDWIFASIVCVYLVALKVLLW